jgi:hypothetical protein
MDERLSSSSMACTYSSSLVRPQGRHHHCLDGNTVDEHSGAQIVAPASASTAHDDGLEAEPGNGPGASFNEPHFYILYPRLHGTP